MYCIAKKKSQTGFTLIDMMVSVALFSAIVLICVGSLAAIIDVNRKDTTLRQVLDNMNVIVENMSRNVRVGSKYYCSNSPILIVPGVAATESADCPFGGTPNGGNYLAFRNKDGKTELYAFDSGNSCIARKITNSTWQNGYADTGVGVGSGYSCITDPAATISSFRFYVYGTQSATQQPRVIVAIRGTAGTNQKNRTDFNIMTSLSQRIRHNWE